MFHCYYNTSHDISETFLHSLMILFKISIFVLVRESLFLYHTQHITWLYFQLWCSLILCTIHDQTLILCQFKIFFYFKPRRDTKLISVMAQNKTMKISFQMIQKFSSDNYKKVESDPNFTFRYDSMDNSPSKDMLRSQKTRES